MNRYRNRLALIAIILPCIALLGWGRIGASGSPAADLQQKEPAKPAPQTAIQQQVAVSDRLQEEIHQLRKDLELAVDLLEKSFGKPIRLEAVRSVPVTITAYSSTPDQCDSTPHITASNEPVRHGVVAVSDDLIEEGLHFGERILIPGHGLFEVQDRMNSRWERRVDIWQSDREAALLFGKQEGTMLWLADI